MIASSFQVPIHIAGVAGQPFDPRDCVVRLSTTARPSSRTSSSNVARATLFYAPEGNYVLWLFGENPEILTRAVQSLANRSGFPEIRCNSESCGQPVEGGVARRDGNPTVTSLSCATNPPGAALAASDSR